MAYAPGLFLFTRGEKTYKALLCIEINDNPCSASGLVLNINNCINKDNDDEEAHRVLSCFITNWSDFRSPGRENLRMHGPDGCRGRNPFRKIRVFRFGAGTCIYPLPLWRRYRISHAGIRSRIGRAGNIP